MTAPLPDRLYARLVRLLPREFAAAYGADMATTFAQRARAARARGGPRFLLFVLRECAGLARVAVVEHAAALRRGRPDTSLPAREATSPMGHLLRETRPAVRRLLRTPGFTAAALFTLALAIGANTAIFTLLHRIVLSPLPYPAAERLIALDHTAPGVGLPSGVGISPGLYRAYGALPSVAAIAIYQEGEATLSGDGEAERVESLDATPSLGGLVDARPALGRWFTEADGAVGAAGAAVLSHALWVRRFGASADVLGRVIRVDGTAHAVIGVMPPGFAFPNDRAEVILPLALDAASTRFGGFNYQGIARLRPGVSVEEARRQQDAVIADVVARFPDDAQLTRALVGEVRLGSLARPYKDHVLGDTARTLWVLLGSVLIVLLIAGANLANLFLVRTEARQREVALRRALGAGTGKVAAYFLAETLLVALCSGALALGIGHLALKVLVLNGPVALPRLHEVRMDGVAVGFTVLAALLAGLVLGLMPLARRLALAAALQDAARGSTAGRSRMHARQVLMAAQVALAVVLLVAAGLMVQSVHRLRSLDVGFRTDGRLVFRIGLPRSQYPTGASAADFHERLLERLRGVPGVTHAALTTTLPLDGEGSGDPLQVRGRPDGWTALGMVARFRRVSTDYVVTMGMPLRRGRLLDERDAAGSASSALIDEALAAHYFPGEDPIGRQLRPVGADEADGWLTVVGVVGNTPTAGLREPAPMPQLYVPLRNQSVVSGHGAAYVLRTTGNPIGVVPAVRRALAELDPNVAIARPERLADVVARAGAGLAFSMVLLVLAAAVALILGVVGVYAVISYGVAQRQGEIGVRLALGARPGHVTGMIVRQSGGVIAVGVLLGMGAAVGSTRLLQALLFGVAWNDVLTYAAVALGIFGVAMLACWLPARRAAHLDPLTSLRRD